MDSTELSYNSLSKEKPETVKHEKKNGLSLMMTSIFITGEMAGSGVLALPKAVSDSGWIGILLIVVCCLNALYAGICLGRCWLIMEERWIEYRQKNRRPYQAIGERAVGKWMSYVVSFCMESSLFGVSTVFLLLCAQLINSLTSSLVDFSFCYWTLVLAGILCPLMWLGTPDDFWPAAVGALVTTSIACLLIFVAIITDDRSEVQQPKYSAPTFDSFFLALGTILFAFGGASNFPTFQNDMRNKKQFPAASTIAFTGLLILYLPVAIVGYKVFGSSLVDNVLQLVQTGHLRVAAEILICIHLFFAFLIAINPVSQEIEEFLKIPKAFGWKRCIVRTAIMVLIVFVAETVPHFGKILNLVGASTIMLLTLVLPPLFYIMLCRQKDPRWPERCISLHEKVYLIEVIVIGTIGGVISTYTALQDIVGPSAFTMPCYVNMTSASG